MTEEGLLGADSVASSSPFDECDAFVITLPLAGHEPLRGGMLSSATD